MRPFRRADRVAGELQAALSQILQDGLRDPRVTAVTLTAVRVSDDLRHAWVGFVPLGGKGDVAQIAEGLSAAAGYLRRELGRRVRLKYLPELHFEADEGIDESVRLAQLLAEMERRREDQT